MRFTSRDPVFGKFEQPMTLHKYLYCQNDPINRIDSTGLTTYHITGTGVLSLLGFPRVSRQSGFVWDDKGNWGWMNNTGIGGGTPQISAGITIGFTTADTIYDLENWSTSIGGGWGNVSGDILVGKGRNGEGWLGLQGTVSGTVPGSSFTGVPDMHGEAAHCTIYDFNLLFRSITEEAMANSSTLGEAYFYFIMWGNAPD
jgi:hypothetical protein